MHPEVPHGKLLQPLLHPPPPRPLVLVPGPLQTPPPPPLCNTTRRHAKSPVPSLLPLLPPAPPNRAAHWAQVFINWEERLELLLNAKVTQMCTSSRLFFAGSMGNERGKGRKAAWRLPPENFLVGRAYGDVPPELRVLVLLALCEERLEAEEARVSFLSEDTARVEPVCRGGGLTWYYFGDEVCSQAAPT